MGGYRDTVHIWGPSGTNTPASKTIDEQWWHSNGKGKENLNTSIILCDHLDLLFGLKM